MDFPMLLAYLHILKSTCYRSIHVLQELPTNLLKGFQLESMIMLLLFVFPKAIMEYYT